MDLVFSLAERWSQAGEPAGIGGTVEFRTDVFDAASIEALIERFRRVVVAITADPTRPLSSIDLLDADEHARLDAIGNRAVLTQPVTTPVSIPALLPRRWPAHPRRWRWCAVRSRGLIASLMRPLTGWRTCCLGRVWARVSVWRCCWSDRLRRSWRCWRCSRPGRPICRSTRFCRRRIGFMLDDAAPIAAITGRPAVAAGRV